MLRVLPLLVAVSLAVPAQAAERTYSVGSFDHVRVDGPFEVRIATGASPSARATADQAVLDRLDIEVNGTTLVVRIGTGGWGETPKKAGRSAAPVITLATPRLVAAMVNAGAKVTIATMKSQRIDLSLAGAGSIDVGTATADQLNAIVVGPGSLTLGGRVNRARLLTNGPGTIDATGLIASDLVVRLEGLGETRATARYTAQVTSTGLGKVTVLGGAKCVVNATAGGPVDCGGK